MGVDPGLARIWSFVYERISRVPKPTFWHREFSGFSPEDLVALQKSKILKRLPEAEFVSDGKGHRFRVVRTKNQILGVLEAEEAKVIDLNPDDLIAYRVDPAGLVNGIRERNQLSGRPDITVGSPWYLGSKESDQSMSIQVLFSYGLKSADLEAASLLAAASSSEPVFAVFPIDIGLKRDRRLADAGVNVCKLGENLEILWPKTLHSPKRDDGIAPELVMRTIEAGFGQVGVKVSEFKEESELLKSALSEKLTHLAGEVEPEYFTWILHVLAAGSVSGAAKVLGIPNSTFSEKLKAYRERGGIYETLFRLHEARRRTMGTRKLEGFNELYREHQQSFSSSNADLLKEVFEAFSEQTSGNWEAIKTEMLEALREVVP